MVDLTYIIIYSILGILVLFLIGFWLLIKSYNYQVRIRENTSGRVKIIHDTIGKIKKDSDKIEYLALWNPIGSTKAIPIPTPEAIDYNPKKKKKVVEAWYDEENGINYISDDGKSSGFQPLTTKQRAMLVSQIHKKESRKVNSWKDNIPLIVSMSALVIIVAVFMIFWGEAIEPIHSAAQTSTQALDKANELWGKIIAFERGEQVVGGNLPPPS